MPVPDCTQTNIIFSLEKPGAAFLDLELPFRSASAFTQYLPQQLSEEILSTSISKEMKWGPRGEAMWLKYMAPNHSARDRCP